ncbi:Pkhd1l1 [Symbiodinium microadriaticum]|nr:Pkhd1l1 [Symbiodinium microadriaticum]
MARSEFFLVLAASCAVAADAATITTVYPDRGSTEGGTYLVISGSGFMMPTEANPWDSQVVYVGSKICNIMAHYTSSTQIVCMTTPHDVVAESSESLTVSVQIFGGLGLASYASKSSAFQYHWQDTALIHWANHWAGTGGDIMEFGGDIRAGATSAGQFEIRVGDAWCHVDEEVWPLSNRRRSWTKQVSCQLPDDDLLIPGYYNVTIRVNSLDRADGDCPNSLCFPYTEEQAGTGYGHGFAAIVNPPPSDSNGKLNRVWGGMLDIVTGHTYHFTVYPQVRLSPCMAGLNFRGS